VWNCSSLSVNYSTSETVKNTIESAFGRLAFSEVVSDYAIISSTRRYCDPSCLLVS